MKRFIKHMAIPALCCIMTLTLFRVFFFLGYVPTSSMEPTIRQGSFIVAARMAYWSSEPNVGDIIVFSHDGKVLVKRVAAVAGEAAWTWKGPETVPCGMLYLLGDNIDASIDSRLWLDPFVPVENVIARYYEENPGVGTAMLTPAVRYHSLLKYCLRCRSPCAMEADTAAMLTLSARAISVSLNRRKKCAYIRRICLTGSFSIAL